MAQRTRACTACHGDQGRAGPDGYYPRLAGKPAGYLYNQLRNIRDGRRHYPLMADLIEPLSEAYLKQIALYFSALNVAYPPPEPSNLPSEVLQRGHTLVTQGDASREIPPCQQCHGQALTGAQPHVPGLLGLPRDYLNAQLGGWRTGQRHAQTPDCMAQIASRLAPQDIAAVTGWLAAQPLPTDTHPLAALPARPAGVKEIRCGSADFAAAVQRPDDPVPPRITRMPQVEQGEYLARVGNCAACHTAPGGAQYAGRRALDTPFGIIYTSNLTSDKATGLGQWTADDFWQALHQGRSRDGHLLSPAFPYTSFTQITRTDSDALFAYFRTIEPVNLPNLSHELRWPFGTQAALWVWQTLFFKPQTFVPQTNQSAAFNRGSYLVNGLAHCNACHTPRNFMGAPQDDDAFSGATMPVQNWRVPSLVTVQEAGTDRSNLSATLDLLHSGMSAKGVANGPMRLVVQGSTQYLRASDLQAVGSYLQSLIKPDAARQAAKPTPHSAPALPGAKLYQRHCADCHGPSGQGVAGAYPALQGSRPVMLADSRNIIQTVLHGGFAPVTSSNPQPFGMPPFVLTLSDSEIANVLTFIRRAWGNQAAPVTEQDVSSLRDQQLHQ